MDFGDLDIRDKQELGALMRRRKYLSAKTYEGRQNQLDGAWNYLTSKYGHRKQEYRTSPKRIYIVKGYRVERDAKGRFKKWLK